MTEYIDSLAQVMQGQTIMYNGCRITSFDGMFYIGDWAMQDFHETLEDAKKAVDKGVLALQGNWNERKGEFADYFVGNGE